MGYRQAGYTSYPAYLSSDWFGSVRQKAWRSSRKCCSICSVRFGLQAHHLSYSLLGTRLEWRSIRFLCAYHHQMVSYCFWVVKLHRTPGLVIWYYLVRLRWIIVHKSWDGLVWLYRHMIDVEWDERKEMWVPKTR